MGGGLAQLSMFGTADAFLVGNPEVTYFKQLTRRHTLFSLESIEQHFTGPVDFNGRATVTVSKTGDLVWMVWVQVTLPDLTAYGQPYLRWCDSPAHALLASVELEIGGARIDRHVPVWLDAWSELTMPEEKRPGFQRMVGKGPGNAPSTGGVYYVPLQFFFCKAPSLSLPLVALMYHDVKLNFEFAPYQALIRNSTTTLALSPAPSLVDCKVFVDYVYLDNEERRRFIATRHEMVIEQLQVQGDEAVLQTNAGSINRKILLNLSQPVQEIVWVYSAWQSYQTDAVLGNDIFNYDIPDHAVTLPNGSSVLVSSLVGNVAALEPVESAKLVLNGSDRFAERPGSYFRLVQPYQHHTRCPSKKVYAYSFALFPEAAIPSGSCNFNRIDTATLNLTLNKYATSGKVQVFARNHNVLRIFQGQAGLAFAA